MNLLFDLAKLVFVDCGASYFPPDTWQAALAFKASHLVLVDPNSNNLTYSNNISCSTSVIPKALSSSKSLQILYLANIDSGSSLLPHHRAPT